MARTAESGPISGSAWFSLMAYESASFLGCSLIRPYTVVPTESFRPSALRYSASAARRRSPRIAIASADCGTMVGTGCQDWRFPCPGINSFHHFAVAITRSGMSKTFASWPAPRKTFPWHVPVAWPSVAVRGVRMAHAKKQRRKENREPVCVMLSAEHLFS